MTATITRTTYATLANTANESAARRAAAYLNMRYAKGQYNGDRFDAVPVERNGIESYCIVVWGVFAESRIDSFRRIAEAFLEGFRQPYEAISEI